MCFQSQKQLHLCLYLRQHLSVCTVTEDCFGFFPADSQYRSQFDYKQTEADYLITSEEVTKKNSESSINHPYIRIQHNSLCQPDNAYFTMRKRKLVTFFLIGALRYF